VQLALEQQQQLETLRAVIEQQNRHITRLCQRDATLGLNLRQPGVQDKNASRTVSAAATATGKIVFLGSTP